MYQRYFTALDAVFVHNIFKTLANMPLEIELDENTSLELLSSEAVTSLNPMFSKLEISLGDHPDIPESAKHCSTSSTTAAFCYTSRALGDWAYISLCDTIWQYPSLSEIEHSSDPSKRGEPGWGCDGIGDHDSEYMTSPGGILLHEMLHWYGLFQDVPYFDQVIEENSVGIPQIGDFQGPKPPDGYGSFHAQQLRSVDNADNFRVYAESKYWGFTCRRSFKGSTDTADDELRTSQRSTQLPPINDDGSLE